MSGGPQLGAAVIESGSLEESACYFPQMQKMFDGYVEGPAGAASGFQCVSAWRDENGFHRMYAVGFGSTELAREAATQGAKDLGYVEPKFWQFWKQRLMID